MFKNLFAVLCSRLLWLCSWSLWKMEGTCLSQAFDLWLRMASALGMLHGTSSLHYKPDLSMWKLTPGSEAQLHTAVNVRVWGEQNRDFGSSPIGFLFNWLKLWWPSLCVYLCIIHVFWWIAGVLYVLLLVLLLIQEKAWNIQAFVNTLGHLMPPLGEMLHKSLVMCCWPVTAAMSSEWRQAILNNEMEPLMSSEYVIVRLNTTKPVTHAAWKCEWHTVYHHFDLYSRFI